MFFILVFALFTVSKFNHASVFHLNLQHPSNKTRQTTAVGCLSRGGALLPPCLRFVVMPIKPHLGGVLDLDELFVHFGRETVDLLAWILL